MNPSCTWLMIAVAALLSACVANCDNPSGEETAAATSQRSAASWQESYLALGRETYERACASCHDPGTEGAPAIGDRDAWSDRSPLWSAVLLEHAKSGYLDMPAKGGFPELSEQAVEAAGEYMLGETFPELLRD